MQQTEKTAHVIGLSCPKCKEKVKNAILAITGVTGCTIDGEMIHITMDTDIEDARIKDTIEGMGTYWVEEIS